jgi:hypothetical protein
MRVVAWPPDKPAVRMMWMFGPLTSLLWGRCKCLVFWLVQHEDVVNVCTWPAYYEDDMNVQPLDLIYCTAFWPAFTVRMIWLTGFLASLLWGGVVASQPSSGLLWEWWPVLYCEEWSGLWISLVVYYENGALASWRACHVKVIWPIDQLVVCWSGFLLAWYVLRGGGLASILV